MLRLVLPKGSLERATLQLFEDADLAVVRSSDVDYRAAIDDPRVIDVTILRPQEIPRYVADGLFDLGVTGRDWVEETGVDVVTLTQLHYSKATARPFRNVLAVAGDSKWVALAERCRVLVRLSVEEASLSAVIDLLRALKSPTVSKLFGEDGYAVETVVARHDINTLIPALKDHGATGILEIPISKIVQ